MGSTSGSAMIARQKRFAWFGAATSTWSSAIAVDHGKRRCIARRLASGKKSPRTDAMQALDQTFEISAHFHCRSRDFIGSDPDLFKFRRNGFGEFYFPNHLAAN